MRMGSKQRSRWINSLLQLQIRNMSCLHLQVNGHQTLLWAEDHSYEKKKYPLFSVWFSTLRASSLPTLLMPGRFSSVPITGSRLRKFITTGNTPLKSTKNLLHDCHLTIFVKGQVRTWIKEKLHTILIACRRRASRKERRICPHRRTQSLLASRVGRRSERFFPDRSQSPNQPRRESGKQQNYQ